MSVAAFLAELRSRDIHVWADGDQLRCNAPAGMLTTQLSDRLRQRKHEILEFLRAVEAVARQQSAIVPMQPRGTRTPIFAVPGHNGDIFAYRDLVRHLGDDQPFFALHPPGLDGDSEPLGRAEDIAAYFVQQIEAFRPSGPFIIAGYCAAGAVALELAQQLTRRGATVSFLALFGCAYPKAYRRLAGLPYWGWRIAMHLRVVATMRSLKEGREYLLERLSARRKWARIEKSPAGTDAVSVMKFRFEQAHAAMVRRYSPRRFVGRVCHFLPNREWTHTVYAPLRWKSVAPRIEEYYGPDSCNPDRMLLEPNVSAFAELFRRCQQGNAEDSQKSLTLSDATSQISA